MEVALTAPRSLPFPLRCRITISRDLGYPRMYSYSRHWKLTVKASVRAPTADHFGEPNKFTAYLHVLSETVGKSLPKQVKELPWKKAEEIVLHRLLQLGRKALKWFLVAFLLVNFASDAFFSFSRNMELTIPLGLFIGITLADFLVETSKELLQSSPKDNGFENQLLGLGTLFACIKLVTPYIALPGRMVLSHISSGGLIQVMWLVKELHGTKVEEDVESPSSDTVESQEAVV